MRNNTFELYSIMDPALDLDAMGKDLAVYAVRRDTKLLRFVPAAKPTRFICHDIPTSLSLGWVSAGGTDEEIARRAFSVGVVRVENLTDKTDTWRAIIEPTGTIQTATGRRACWTQEEIDLITDAHIEEIGGAIRGARKYPFGYKPILQVPPLLGPVLAQIHPRLVDWILDEHRQSKETPRGAPAPDSASDGAVPTDATVTGKATSSSAESPIQPQTGT